MTQVHKIFYGSIFEMGVLFYLPFTLTVITNELLQLGMRNLAQTYKFCKKHSLMC
jgi:type III secretory pathway component EscR